MSVLEIMSTDESYIEDGEVLVGFLRLLAIHTFHNLLLFINYRNYIPLPKLILNKLISLRSVMLTGFMQWLEFISVIY